jgi:hypothetical protein
MPRSLYAAFKILVVAFSGGLKVLCDVIKLIYAGLSVKVRATANPRRFILRPPAIKSGRGVFYRVL